MENLIEQEIQAFKCLRIIENDRSRNNKKEALKDLQNEFLTKLLLYTYDMSKTYGIGAKSIAKLETYTATVLETKPTQRMLFGPKKQVSTKTYNNIFELLDELITHPYGSTTDVEAVLSFLSNCSDEQSYWFSKVILKDLRIGFTAISINEIITDLIPIHRVQKGDLYDPDTHKLDGVTRQCDKKIDGYRMYALVTQHGAELFTDNGGQFLGFKQIEQELNEIYKVCKYDFVFDGELQHADGTFNSTQKIAFKQGDKIDCIFHVFDMITPDEYYERIESPVLFERTLNIDCLLNKLPDLRYVQHVEVVGYTNSEDTIKAWLKESLSKGWEGLMIKENLPFIKKRHSGWIKMKRHETADLHVIDVLEGTGSNVGKLGAVVVEYKGNTVRIGGGYSKSERSLFWNNPNLILDKIIEVSYMQETRNKDGNLSLRHPQFEGIRDDK